MALKAVLFDFDGTLLDTREYIYQSFERTLTTHGHHAPDRAAIAAAMGKHLRDTYPLFVSDGDIEALMKTHKETVQPAIRHLVEAYEHLHEMLAELHDLGLRIGVCTSRGSHTTDLMRKVGVHNDIDVLVTADDVDNHKPHPESLLIALKKLEIAPSEAVMVGDTPADIGAGKNAGVAFTVGITHGFGDEKILREAGADFIIHHLAELVPTIRERALV